MNEEKEHKSPDMEKRRKRKKKLIITAIIILAWFLAGKIITLIFGKAEGGQLSIDILPERTNFLGLDLSVTIICSWIAIAAVVILAVLIRIFVIPRMKDNPKGIQNVLEVAVSGISDYTQKQTGHLGENLSAYIFTVAVFLVASCVVELFGFRPPSSDITVTFALALISFFLINYYGIKQKGISGRIKALASPTPVILPMKLISEIAVPISLACRLFGNMLGGLIVIDLVYYALGNNSLLIPSVLGLFFNVAHPIIQIFIFITLTLTFINEAAELANE